MLKRFLVTTAILVAFHAHAGLNLQSDRALVIDRNTGKTLYAKSASEPAPIASVTKLMTAMVLLDEKPDLKTVITITEDDVDTLKGSSSRLPLGAQLTRKELLHLALMSSENRAAHALARTSSNGLSSFVASMNKKAKALGMKSARFTDPTGLSPRNRASAADLAKLLEAAADYEAIREFSTSKAESISVDGYELSYRNTNPAVRKGWDVEIQKTGFIREAGRVVVMAFTAAGKKLDVVLMGADTTAARTQDLVRVRNWVAGIGEPTRMTASTSLKRKASTVRQSAAKSVKTRRAASTRTVRRSVAAKVAVKPKVQAKRSIKTSR